MKSQILTITKSKFYFLSLILAVVLLAACKQEKKKEPPIKEQEKKKEVAFKQRKIVDSAKYWWAHTPADVSRDGIADLIFINQNSAGGYLGYYKGQKEPGLWALNIIAETPPNGGLFASGDMEAADIDGDGDLDVFAVKHPGEWTDAGATAELFWYENEGSSWQAHAIGTAPDAVKDVSFADFDNDGKTDMAILTFDEHTLSVFKQEDKEKWQRVQYIQNDALHEGMGVGDFDGDGYIDIVATGLIYTNPNGELEKDWSQTNLGEEWNDQVGDWSRNGTKTFVTDVDNDGLSEIYMAHSERAGYPLVFYKKYDSVWQPTVIKDSIPANHTLQVFDFDLDGDLDVVAGINKGRAVNLDKEDFSVYLFLNQGDYKSYTEKIIETQGIYNGQAIDYDGDGDFDIFRYPDHEASDFFLMENTLLDK